MQRLHIYLGHVNLPTMMVEYVVLTKEELITWFLICLTEQPQLCPGVAMLYHGNS